MLIGADLFNLMKLFEAVFEIYMSIVLDIFV